MTDEQFVECLREQTDSYFLSNDLEETDSIVLWDAYKAYIIDMINEKKNKEKIAKQFELEKQISNLQRQYYILKSEDILTQLKYFRTLLNNLMTPQAERYVLFAR